MNHPVACLFLFMNYEASVSVIDSWLWKDRWDGTVFNTGKIVVTWVIPENLILFSVAYSSYFSAIGSDVFTWNVPSSACSRNGCSEESTFLGCLADFGTCPAWIRRDSSGRKVNNIGILKLWTTSSELCVREWKYENTKAIE